MRIEHYARTNVPPGVIPLELLSPRDLLQLGYDPVKIYQLQSELEEMGLGLGFSIGGLIKGIGKGIGKAAGAVAKVAKPVIKTVASATPVGTALRTALAIAPNVVAALRKKGKRPETATAADIAQAQAEVALTPQVIEERPASGVTVPPAYFAPHSKSANWNGTAWVEPSAPMIAPPAPKSGLDFNKIAALIARTTQAVPQVQQAVESVREAVAPSAPSTSVTVTAPSGDGGGGVQQAGVAGGGTPGWLLPAAGVAALFLLRGR